MKNQQQDRKISKNELVKIKKTFEDALIKCEKLIQLKKNVKLSKPILQKIQNKIKKRESILEKKIEQEIKNKQQSINKIQQYKKLHQLGVNILEKNGLLSNFDGLDNYVSNKVNIEKENLDSVRYDIRRYMNASDTHYLTNKQISETIQQQSVRPEFNKNKKLSAYQILQNKLNSQHKQHQNLKDNIDLTVHIKKIQQITKKNSQQLRQMKTTIHNQYETKRKSKQKLTNSIQQKYLKNIGIQKLNKFIEKKKGRIQKLRDIKTSTPQAQIILNLRKL